MSRASGATLALTSALIALGGTSVLIVVGVALELVDRLNAQLVMRNYEGAMKSGGPGWTKTEGGQ